ncbi:MAG: S8 family serine peptidase [Trueperaceae bacterium]|nr:S8 family serine peptidase [Trueperaceae bacterium]
MPAGRRRVAVPDREVPFLNTSFARLFPVAAIAAVLAACAAPTSPSADWTTWEDGYAEYAALAAAEGEVGLAATVEPQRYILSQNGALRGVDRAAARRGDTLRVYLPDAGFAVVETRDPGAYARFANVIVPDRVVNWRLPTERVAIDPDAANPPNSGDDDAFFDRQWGHDAVNAPEAWATGIRGQDVVVAVLDGGFSVNHPDIASSIVGSMDFTGEGLEYGPNSEDPVGIFSHGMHVAGTIAAADNGLGTIGVAPEAKLLLLKVLLNYGSGSFEGVIEGIIYAADHGADIANMSLGADIPQGLGRDAAGVAALRVAMQRALNYGTWKGTLYIAAAGNDARDFDADQSTVVFPAQLAKVIGVSATGPAGWGADPSTSLDELAIYSNYGRSGIDVSAPGGDYRLLVTDPALASSPCTVAGVTRPCYVWDFVFSLGSDFGGNWYYWSVGTSMAAPHAAGIAALILSEHGGSGSMTPAQLERALEERAADLGQPGKDPVHGDGAVRSGY